MGEEGHVAEHAGVRGRLGEQRHLELLLGKTEGIDAVEGKLCDRAYQLMERRWLGECGKRKTVAALPVDRGDVGKVINRADAEAGGRKGPRVPVNSLKGVARRATPR